MIDIDQTYHKILSELKQGHRGKQFFSKEDLAEINVKLGESINDKLDKVLCLLCHSQEESLVFEDELLKKLKDKSLSSQQIIYTLEAFRKHVINVHQRKGNRLNFNHLKVLEDLISHESYEVLEWTIRTIDSLGSQAVYFRARLVEIYPQGIIINKQKRMIRKLISYMEQKWGHYEKQFT